MSYLPKDYTPHAKSCGELYAKAMKELAEPFPAVRIDALPRLTALTGGFRTREFSILCGATGVGKTCFLANLSAALLKQRESHFVASVETGATDFIKRVISVVEHKDLNRGEIVEWEVLKKIHVTHGGHFQSDCLQLSLYDDRFSVETLMADIQWMVKNRGIKIAMIDNLNFFMEITSAQNQVIEMDRVIHELIIFCKQVDVHLIMVMHPKKTDSGRVENEFDVKGSSTAIQEAHNVFLFNRAHPELINNNRAYPTDRELKIQKMRRLGAYVGKRLLLRCNDGVSYLEGDIL